MQLKNADVAKVTVILSSKIQATILTLDSPSVSRNIVFPEEVVMNTIKSEPLKTFVSTRTLGVYSGENINIFDEVAVVTNLYIEGDSLYADIESIPTPSGKIFNHLQEIVEFGYSPMGTIKVDPNNRVTQLNIYGISLKPKNKYIK